MSFKDDFSKPKIIQFPKIQDPKGNLTFMQNPDQVPYYGLYLPKLTWRHMENFSTNSLSLHISSKEFTEGDYVREFELLQELSQ